MYPDDDGSALCAGVTVHHMDLWRLAEGKVTELVDLPKVFAECVSLIEWPDRLGAANVPAAYLAVDLVHDATPDDEEAMDPVRDNIPMAADPLPSHVPGDPDDRAAAKRVTIDPSVQDAADQFAADAAAAFVREHDTHVHRLKSLYFSRRRLRSCPRALLRLRRRSRFAACPTPWHI